MKNSMDNIHTNDKGSKKIKETCTYPIAKALALSFKSQARQGIVTVRRMFLSIFLVFFFFSFF